MTGMGLREARKIRGAVISGHAKRFLKHSIVHYQIRE